MGAEPGRDLAEFVHQFVVLVLVAVRIGNDVLVSVALQEVRLRVCHVDGVLVAVIRVVSVLAVRRRGVVFVLDEVLVLVAIDVILLR